MAYQIQYKPELRKKYPLPKKKSAWNHSLVTFAILVVLLGLAISRKGVIWELLVPGDAAATTMAVETLADNLQAGVDLKEAATAFCKEILSHANIYG